MAAETNTLTAFGLFGAIMKFCAPYVKMKNCRVLNFLCIWGVSL